MNRFALCNEMFGEMPQRDGLRIGRSLGYTGVEVAPFTLGESASSISSRQRAEYRNLVASEGMEVIGLHWLLAKTQGYHLTTTDAEVRKRTAAYLCELAILCADLGGSIMVLGSPLQRNFPDSMNHAEASKNAADVIAQVVPTLEQCHVRLAIEPLGPQEGNFLNHAHQARELIQAVGFPNVQLHLDVKAMSTEGIPIDQVIADNADLLIHFHANDPNRLGPGMGDVDQRPIFQSLRKINYHGWISVEVFDYSLGVERTLRESMQNMIAALEN